MMNERIEIITGLAKQSIFPHPHNEVLYKYVDVDTAIKILTGGTLKFQAPNFFNDVFDPHLGLLDITKGRERIQNEIFKKYSPETIEKYLQTHSLEEIEQTADTVVMKWINKAGILCLSKNYKHTLMWSHYAAKHTGVCLGFTNIGYIENDGICGFRIDYATELIPR